MSIPSNGCEGVSQTFNEIPPVLYNDYVVCCRYYDNDFLYDYGGGGIRNRPSICVRYTTVFMEGNVHSRSIVSFLGTHYSS